MFLGVREKVCWEKMNLRNETTKLNFRHYLFVVIILFNTGLSEGSFI